LGVGVAVRSRSGGALERFNSWLKLRTRVVRIFPDREACRRLVTALSVELSEEWLSDRWSLGMGPHDGRVGLANGTGTGSLAMACPGGTISRFEA